MNYKLDFVNFILSLCIVNLVCELHIWATVSTVGQNEENLEFEADAAAALLQLKRRRSSSDHNQQKPSKTVE